MQVAVPRTVRRNRALWVLLAGVAVVVLVLAGRSTGGSGTSEDRLFSLAEQLKCLQCVGESVAGSQAPLAEQFRQEIREQMSTGATDREILDFFVDRYGEQVLLTPPSSGVGSLVWVLPVAFVGFAVLGLALVLPRWRTAAAGSAPEATDSEPAGHPGAPEPAPEGPEPSATRRKVPLAVTVGGLLVFFALLGALVMRGSSERTSPGGTVEEGSSEERLSACRSLAMRDPSAAVRCYEDELELDPDSVEAMAYGGWAKVRAGDAAGGASMLDAAVQADPSYPDARAFRAIVARDDGDLEEASRQLDAFYSLDPGGLAESIVATEGLEQDIFFGLMSEPARACWGGAASSGGEDASIDREFLDRLGSCLDAVLASDPADRSARFSRALAHTGTPSGDAVASGILEQLLGEDPDDSDALGLLATLQLAAGDLAAAEATIVRLEGLPRASSAFLLGDAEMLRDSLGQAASAGTPAQGEG